MHTLETIHRARQAWHRHTADQRHLATLADAELRRRGIFDHLADTPVTDDPRQATGDSRRAGHRLAGDGAGAESWFRTRAELDQAVARAREALARIGAEARGQANRRAHQDATPKKTGSTWVSGGQAVQGTRGAGGPETARLAPAAPPPTPPSTPARSRRAPGPGR